MSRPAGRRVAGRRSPAAAAHPPLSRVVVLPLVAVLVALGALAVAGLAGRNSGEAAPQPPRQAIGDRVFSCADGIPHAQLLSGSVEQGARERALRRLERVQVPHDEARGAFAVQVASQGASYALGRCPEPANEWWFVGAGGSVGHSTTLVVDNPRPGAAVFDIEVLGPKGEVAAPGLRGITLAGNSSRSFDLTRVAPSTGDLAAHVTTSRGLVAVTAVDSFTLGTIGGVTHEWIPAQASAERDLTLVGLAGRPGGATLLVANPGTVESVVGLELVGPKGSFTPKGSESVTVAPGSVAALPLTKAFDGDPSGLHLTGSGPIVATVRTVTGKDQAYAPAGQRLDGTSVVAVPAGGSRQLLVTAGTDDTQVHVVPHTGAGRSLPATKLDVDAQTTVHLALPAAARYAEVTVTGGGPVAGVLVSRGAARGAIAVPPAVSALTLPAVRPGW